MRFQGTDDSNRNIYLWPGMQVGKIPPQTLAGSERTLLRRDAGEQRGCIFIQIAIFILEYYQGVPAASQKKVKERRGGVEPISQDQIERARIRADHPLQ